MKCIVRRTVIHSALAATIACSAIAACDACRSPRTAETEKPTLRLYLVSNVAGALEPCGCVKDQLGGLDHVAALMMQGKKAAPDSALVVAGPLFFLDPVVKEERKSQELAKAQTIADILKGFDFVGVAPGRNDWALGGATLGELATRGGGGVLACNAKPQSALFHASIVRVSGGIKVGFVGVASPDKSDNGASLDGVAFESPADAVKTEVSSLRAQGAQVLIAIAAVGRGEAKRIADAVPELTAIVVGATSQGGEENTNAPPPELVGNVLVAETSNHLQTVGALDLFVRKDSFSFHDGTGIAQGQKRKELDGRIDELHAKIADWEKDAKISAKDLEARRADLKRIEAERKALDDVPPPKEGSFFQYRVLEVRDSLGADDTVKKQFLAYYKKVNDGNRTLFATRMPPAPPADGNVYAGLDACVACHPAPKAVWDKTAHAHAYKTLEDGFKEFNLDCVSCHVTGYEQPGGASVTHVEKLKDVQCEDCHGPSSLHAANPTKVHSPFPKPSAARCADCHHPPHVHTFNAAEKMPAILGPGHGR